MKKTAKQLAEELGVSATTVSMALRGSGNISAATKERVIAAARAAGMEIPQVEKPKEAPVCRDYALICSDYIQKIELSPYPNPMTLSMIRDMGMVCARAGARLMTIFSIPEDLDAAPFDGYFFYTNVPEGLNRLKTTKPIVCIDREPAGYNSVSFDQEGSMEPLSRWIEEKGFRRPFFFFVDAVHPKFARSRTLLEEELRQKGIRMEIDGYNQDGAVGSLDVDGQREFVRESVQKLIRKKERKEPLPDIIICNNDCFAGLMQLELAEAGIRAGSVDAGGETIPLVGFDDIPYVPGAGLFTTFHTDTKTLSEAALELMETVRKRPQMIRHLRIEPEMKIR